MILFENKTFAMQISKRVFRIGIVLAKNLSPIRIFKRGFKACKNLIEETDPNPKPKSFFNKKRVKVVSLIFSRIIANAAMEMFWPDKPIRLEKEEMNDLFDELDLDDSKDLDDYRDYR